MVNGLFFVVLTGIGWFAIEIRCLMEFSGRRGYCGGDIFFWIALANLVTFLIFNLRLWPTLLSAFLVAFPATTIALSIYITAPLFKELRATDLSVTCYYQVTGSEYLRRPRDKTERLVSTSDADPGLFVGVHSPRIYKFSDGKVYKWAYTRRKFKGGVPITAPPEACE